MSRRLQLFRMHDENGNDMGTITIAGVYHLTPWEKIHEGMKHFVFCLWTNYQMKTEVCE